MEIYCSESRAEAMSWSVVLNWAGDRGDRLELWEKEICDSFLGVGLGSFVCLFFHNAQQLDDLKFSWCQSPLFFFFRDLHSSHIARNHLSDLCNIYNEVQYCPP